MAKYLIDGDSLEFAEGAEKEDVLSLSAKAGQTIEVIPLTPAETTTIPISNDKARLVALDTPISDFDNLIVDITVLGLRIVGNTSTGLTGLTVAMRGEDENGNTVVYRNGDLKQTMSVSAAAFFPRRMDAHFTFKKDGSFHGSKRGYEFSTYDTTDSLNADTSDPLPYKITEIGVELTNLNNYVYETGGIVMTVKGVKA